MQIKYDKRNDIAVNSGNFFGNLPENVLFAFVYSEFYLLFVCIFAIRFGFVFPRRSEFSLRSPRPALFRSKHTEARMSELNEYSPIKGNGLFPAFLSRV